MAEADHQADLELLLGAARAAAEVAMGYFRRDPKVWWKDGNSPVSEADYAVDRHLRETLLAARPNYGWLSEETDQEIPAHPHVPGERFFVIDPIDGTRAFLRGEETWCVSVAIVENGRPIAGVIDAPATGEVFAAVANGTATLNGERIAVTAADPRRPLSVAIPDSLRKRLSPSDAAAIVPAPNVPSLAYRLAQVAVGRLDGTLIRPNANDWDIAAGDLILERAGGALVDAAGAPRLYKIEGKRHGVLIAAATHAVPALIALAATLGA